ncbi:MAG: SH3 domain-containing protein [Oscillospiraceae bacterium]|jgi:phage protein D/uncharacterized protein YraI|nr:SH3 domain-containing protein [Oscillospiraceae bacterium]
MIDKDLARRTNVEVYFDGVNISQSLREYLLALDYTDNEEGESDDLQISLEDRDDIWLCKWLDAAIQAAASSSAAGAAGVLYKVTAQSGLNVRSGPGTSHAKVGALAYGAQIAVAAISNGWATITYSGKTAYVSAGYLIAINTGAGGSGSWAIGDAVIANGQPQYSSYGDGTPGASVANYSGTVTYLNLKGGAPYPIHVGKLGWFAEGQVAKASASGTSNGSTLKGMRIQASFVRENWNGDGKDNVLDCGQFELDDVEASGPPSVITIKGTSLPFKAQIRQTKKNRAWESYKLSGIAKEMAAVNGLACMYESPSDPHYDRAEQIATSDIQFLSTLCRNAGIALKVTNNAIVLFDQAAYEAKPVRLTIKRGAGGYTKYKLATGEADAQYASCRVSYVNPSTGASIEATAYAAGYDPDDKNNQRLEISARVRSIAEAQTLAEKRLRLRNKFEKSATFTIPGNPNIMAGFTVMLEGWGAWSGKYIVSQTRHSVGGSGYATQIRLRPTAGVR